MKKLLLIPFVLILMSIFLFAQSTQDETQIRKIVEDMANAWTNGDFEIAFSVGYANLSYFSKSYKEYFGILPSEEIQNHSSPNLK